MRDRFVSGFFAGIIAAFVTGPISYITKSLELSELELSDFAGLLTLGTLPRGLVEDIFSIFVDLMVSGALGIVFAYLVIAIGSKYILFKGWFYASAIWYLYYPLISIVVLDKISPDVMTHIVNSIVAGLFGIVMAYAFYRLHLRSRPDL